MAAVARALAHSFTRKKKVYLRLAHDSMDKLLEGQRPRSIPSHSCARLWPLLPPFRPISFVMGVRGLPKALKDSPRCLATCEPGVPCEVDLLGTFFSLISYHEFYAFVKD